MAIPHIRVRELGLKRKTPFSFSRKAKISENSLTFREKFRIQENIHFREKFNFSRKISRNIFVFAKIFVSPMFLQKFWVLEPSSGKEIFSNNF
jgi:hypothetical protein